MGFTKTCLERQLKETATEIFTAGYSSHNGSAIRPALSHTPVYVDPDPCQHPVEEWRRAKSEARTSAGGVANPAFLSNGMYFNDNTDHNQNFSSSLIELDTTPIKKNITSSKTDNSAPTSQHMYGISTHHSFKRHDAPAQLSFPLKMQLHVPPCRPELPPSRTDDTPRPQTFPDDLNIITPSVHKAKVRKVCSTPKRSKPPSLINHTTPQGDSPRYSGVSRSPRYRQSAV